VVEDQKANRNQLACDHYPSTRVPDHMARRQGVKEASLVACMVGAELLEEGATASCDILLVSLRAPPAPQSIPSMPSPARRRLANSPHARKGKCLPQISLGQSGKSRDSARSMDLRDSCPRSFHFPRRTTYAPTAMWTDQSGRRPESHGWP